MTAEYTTSLLYSGNPYVEALPPMLAGQELIRALHPCRCTAPVTETAAPGSVCNCCRRCMSFTNR